MVSIPMSRDKLLVRLENIGDLLDKSAKTHTVDLKLLMENLWTAANWYNMDLKKMDFKITEMSMTANMELKEMLKRKIQWKTKDDSENRFPKSSISYSDDHKNVSLEPQRIRTFFVEFKDAAENQSIF